MHGGRFAGRGGGAGLRCGRRRRLPLPGCRRWPPRRAWRRSVPDSLWAPARSASPSAYDGSGQSAAAGGDRDLVPDLSRSQHGRTKNGRRSQVETSRRATASVQARMAARAGVAAFATVGRPADVAQLVEHITRNDGVPGSSPGVGLLSMNLAWLRLRHAADLDTDPVGVEDESSSWEVRRPAGPRAILAILEDVARVYAGGNAHARAARG